MAAESNCALISRNCATRCTFVVLTMSRNCDKYGYFRINEDHGLEGTRPGYKGFHSKAIALDLTGCRPTSGGLRDRSAVRCACQWRTG